jgi:hypothetical protein
MDKNIKNKIINHEFPLLESDWKDMQKRLVEGNSPKRNPFAFFTNLKIY